MLLFELVEEVGATRPDTVDPDPELDTLLPMFKLPSPSKDPAGESSK